MSDAEIDSILEQRKQVAVDEAYYALGHLEYFGPKRADRATEVREILSKLYESGVESGFHAVQLGVEFY